MTDPTGYDLFIVGGGIYSTALAAAAAKQNLRVGLCAQHDLTGEGASANNYLLAGGDALLKDFKFSEAKAAYAERQGLRQQAPHLIQPTEFIVPHAPHMKPAWLIQLELWMRNFFARKDSLPPSRRIKLNSNDPENPLNQDFQACFATTECITDVPRLALAQALVAEEFGADLFPRTRCPLVTKQQHRWQVELIDSQSGASRICYATALINTGVTPIAGTSAPEPSPWQTQKSVFLMVRRLYQGPQAYRIQHSDQQVVDVMPLSAEFNLVAMSTRASKDQPVKAAVTSKEETYLLDLVNQYFKQNIKKKNVQHREAVLGLVPSANQSFLLESSPPLVTVFEPELRNYPGLTQSILTTLAPFFTQTPISHKPISQQPTKPSATTNANALPGGDLGARRFEDWQRVVLQQYRWLPEDLFYRLSETYGARIHNLLQGCKNIADLGQDFGAGLHQREIEYLVNHEWARCAEDILWRRTKLGLKLASYQVATVDKAVKTLLSQAKTLEPA